MKKIVKLGIILSSALILSACTSGNLVNQNGNTNQNQQQQQTEEFSIKDLLTQGTSQKCTWSVEDNGQIVSGEIYIKGNKFKQTITSQGDEGNTTVNTINDGEYIYTWSADGGEQDSFAMKMKSGNTTSLEEDDTETFTATDFTDKHQVICTPVTISDDEFTTPSNIEFSDYDDFLNQMTGLGQ